MAFTRLTDDLDVIQKLPDLPNDTGGLTADQLKAKYDEAANVIKDYINATLLEQLEGENGAPSIGIAPIEDVVGTTVQTALETLATMIKQAVIGSIPDHSVTNQQLAFSTINAENIAPAAIGTEQLNNGAVTNDKVAYGIDARKINGLTVGTDNMTDKAVTTVKVADYAVTSAKMASAAVTTDKVASNAVTTAKIADGNVTAAKIANGAVSATYDVTVGTGWSGSTAPYSISVTVSGLLATDKPQVALLASATYSDATSQANAFKYIYRVSAAANTLTLYSSVKPTVNIPIRVTCIRK